MKTLIALLAATLALSAGCGGGNNGEPEEPRERLEKPYADKVKDVEQQNLQRVEDQKKAIDEQTRGGSDGKDDDRG